MDAYLYKTTGENIAFSFDFVDEIPSGISILFKSVTAVDSEGTSATSTVVQSSVISGTEVSARLFNGVQDETYTVTYQATLSDGQILERRLEMRINDNLERYF